jgi:exopolyphosphatase/pppGpp-phosphohydrolase
MQAKPSRSKELRIDSGRQIASSSKQGSSVGLCEALLQLGGDTSRKHIMMAASNGCCTATIHSNCAMTKSSSSSSSSSRTSFDTKGDTQCRAKFARTSQVAVRQYNSRQPTIRLCTRHAMLNTCGASTHYTAVANHAAVTAFAAHQVKYAGMCGVDKTQKCPMSVAIKFGRSAVPEHTHSAKHKNRLAPAAAISCIASSSAMCRPSCITLETLSNSR